MKKKKLKKRSVSIMDIKTEDLCNFCRNGYCEVLSDTVCRGINVKCSFFKTDYQYHKDLDNAIINNRKKGNCKKCKYMITPCRCSYELKNLSRTR